MGTDMVPPVPGALVVGRARFGRSHALTAEHPGWFPSRMSPNEPLTFRLPFPPPRCGGGRGREIARFRGHAARRNGQVVRFAPRNGGCWGGKPPVVRPLAGTLTGHDPSVQRDLREEDPWLGRPHAHRSSASPPLP